MVYSIKSLFKAWSPYSCNGRKHRCKHVSDSVPSNFDTREHFDYIISSFIGTVVNCSVLSSCKIAVTIEDMSPALSQVVLQI